MSKPLSSLTRSLLAISVALAGCSGNPTPNAVPVAGRPTIDRQVLTREEILATEYTNLYDVVRGLRGNWVRTRAADSFTKTSEVQVYLDNQRVGGIDELRSMQVRTVQSIRWFDPIAASARWGTDHGAGVIFVTTAKQ